MNWGGTRSWTSNSTGGKSKETTYIEPFGNMSTIKLLGWSWMQNGNGFVRDSPGIATAVIQGLNPNKQYKYFVKQVSSVPTKNAKITVNHGTVATMSQFSRRRNTYNREGTVAATPRGELVFDFEVGLCQLAKVSNTSTDPLKSHRHIWIILTTSFSHVSAARIVQGMSRYVKSILLPRNIIHCMHCLELFCSGSELSPRRPRPLEWNFKFNC